MKYEYKILGNVSRMLKQRNSSHTRHFFFYKVRKELYFCLCILRNVRRLLILEGYHGISAHHAVVPGVTLIPGAAYLLIVHLVTIDVLKGSLGRKLAWGRKQAIINFSRIINLFMFINRTMRNLVIRKGKKKASNAILVTEQDYWPFSLAFIL